MIYFGWENQEDHRNRQLFAFRSHMAFIQWLARTDGLRFWNAGARDPAQNSEVEKVNPGHIIWTGEEHAPRR